MAEAWMCDHCRGTTPKDVQGWYKLERADSFIGFGEYPGPWHFCSLDHLVLWANRKEQS